MSKQKVNLPSVKKLLEAGAHFGHETKRWHPAYKKYIFTKRGDFHIIDLEKTLEKMQEALDFITEQASKGEILIIGTKRQARDIVRQEAIRCGAHFVINRWVGGLITNFDEIQKSIRRLRKTEKILSGNVDEYSQQRLSVLRKEWARLDRLFGGVKTMERLPQAVVVIDAMYERIPVREVKTSEIPIVGLVDSNTNPKDIDYPIPANDDAIKSVRLFVTYIADAILMGNKGKGVEHEFEDYSMVGIKAEDRKDTEEEKEKEKPTNKKKEKKSKTKSKETKKEKKVKKKKAKKEKKSKKKGEKKGKKSEKKKKGKDKKKKPKKKKSKRSKSSKK